MTSLDTSSLPSSLQQFQHKKLIKTQKTNSAFIFAHSSYDVTRSSYAKQSRIWKTGVANTNAKSDSVCDRVKASCLQLFATLLRVYGKRSRTSLEN